MPWISDGARVRSQNMAHRAEMASKVFPACIHMSTRPFPLQNAVAQDYCAQIQPAFDLSTAVTHAPAAQAVPFCRRAPGRDPARPARAHRQSWTGKAAAIPCTTRLLRQAFQPVYLTACVIRTEL